MKCQPPQQDKWHGVAVTRMNKLVSTLSKEEGLASSVEMCSSDDASSRLKKIITALPKMPDPEVCMQDFSTLLQSTLPLSVTVAGIVFEVQALTSTANEIRPQSKRLFNITDKNGLWFRCCAIGQNALCTCLQPGAHVLLYFAQCRLPLTNDFGMCWCFDDAVLVGLSVGNEVPTLTKEMQFESAQW